MQKTDLKPRSKRFPYWLKQSVRTNENFQEVKRLLSGQEINAVCQSARCPNIYDCFSRKRCTFLILGNLCTRNCKFCAIEGQRKDLTAPAPNRGELLAIKDAVERLELQEVVVTSVTRDDLADGGAGHFADCIEILRSFRSHLKIEVLVPDFSGKESSIDKVVFARPDIFSHNIETVPRLYDRVRPDADYEKSLSVLKRAKQSGNAIVTKSGLMVGFGETKDEIFRAMEDLKAASCDIITIGQYLKPGPGCLEVEKFVHPDEFIKFSEWAKDLGFEQFSCSPFTRSSLTLHFNNVKV